MSQPQRSWTKKKIMNFADTLSNLVSGLGTGRDKMTHMQFVTTLKDPAQLSAMHRSDWLARKIIDIPANDMVRAWRDWQAEEDQIELIEEVEKKLAVKTKLRSAMKKGRLFGGGAVYLGIKNQDPQEELDVETIGKDDLEYIHVMDRYTISPDEVIRDIASPYFGKAEYFRISSTRGNVLRIHASRIVAFRGAEILNENENMDGWGDSVLQAYSDAITNAGFSQAQVASMLHEAKLDIVRIPGLSDHLSTEEGTARIKQRFLLANGMKSSINLLMLEGGETKDSGETWDQKQLNFAQMPEIVQQFLQIASGAADIPVTRLLGQSPAGMNATGESDLRNYYDHISSDQELELQPELTNLDEAIIRSSLGDRPDEIHYRWAPLWQMSEKEAAEVGKAKAETSKIYVDTGIVPPDVMQNAVKNQLIEDGTYPGIEAAYDESDNELDGDLDYGEEPELIPGSEGSNVVPFGGKAPKGQQAVLSRQKVQDATPRTLYVRRDVKNKEEIKRWARSQGIQNIKDDLHVTIIYSHQAVDWMLVDESGAEELKLSAGGPRVMEQFGEATVLSIRCWELEYRHRRIKDAGAAHAHEKYQPHITISKDVGNMLIEEIVPYQGPIILGPEIFEEVKEEKEASK